MAPDLSLSIQYGTEALELPRWRLRRWVQRAVAGVYNATLSENAQEAPLFQAVVLTLRLVDAEEGKQMNCAYRQKDYATNVLTFEYGIAPDGTASGDLVLCMPVLHREAAEQGKSVLDHAAHLTVHGVLHALGYDHLEPDQAQAMEALEVDILKSLGIADPYQA